MWWLINIPGATCLRQASTAQGMAVQVRLTLIRWLGGHQLGGTHSMSEKGHWQHRSLVSQRILIGGSLVLQGNKQLE